MKNRILAVLLALVLAVGLIVVGNGVSFAFSQSTYVSKYEKDWLKDGDMYVEYDFGTWALMMMRF